MLTKIHAELVPDQLPYELFWQRYYFRTSRTSINLGGDGDTSDEEDLGWDEEDEEDDNDNQKGGEASNVQAMVWATVSPPLPLTSLSSASATGQQQERGGGQGCGKAVGGKATGEPSNLATSLPGDLKALAALEERVNVLEGDLSEARRDAESAKAAEAAARIELQKLSAAFDKQQASHKAAVVAASEEAEKRVVSAAADDDHDPGSDGSGLSGELVHASEAVGASPLPPASSPAAERTPALGDDSDEEEDGAWGDDWN